MMSATYPNLFIAGVAKAGTTTVHQVLSAHPQLFLTAHKEPHYFAFQERQPHYSGPHDQAINETEVIWQTAAYEALFRDAHTPIVGECSNSYFYFPGVANRIFEASPDARIIVILRDPVERTYSHYRQAFAIGHEPLSFEAALQAEAERERLNWRWHYQYRRQSLYAERAREYLDRFGPHHILFLRFEQLRHDPAAFFARIFDFIGIPAPAQITPVSANETRLPKSQRLRQAMTTENPIRSMIRGLIPPALRPLMRQQVERLNRGAAFCPPLSPDTRAQLQAYFAQDIEQLERVLQEEFNTWKGA